MFSTKKIYNTITVLPSNIINKIITEIHEKGICQVRNVNSSKNMEHFHEQHRNLESAFLRLRTLQGTIDIFKPQKK